MQRCRQATFASSIDKKHVWSCNVIQPIDNTVETVKSNFAQWNIIRLVRNVSQNCWLEFI